MPKQNAVEKRSSLLAQEMGKTVKAWTGLLTDGGLPWHVKISEQDQVKAYLAQEQDVDAQGHNWLWRERESNGGTRADAEMDRYVRRMRTLLAHHAPDLLLRDFVGPGSVAPEDVDGPRPGEEEM